jgi:hypothetical protein
MNTEYTLQTGKLIKTVNGKVVLNKQYAFDYDGNKANILLKNNGDLHEYKLTNKNINDMFTKIMQNKDISLKDKIKMMLDKEKKQKNKKNNKSGKKKTKKTKKQNSNKTKKSNKQNSNKTKKNKEKKVKNN